MTGTQLAYLAGFFDGEGSVGAYGNSRGGLTLRVQVRQNRSAASLAMFDDWRTTFGGNVSAQRSPNGNWSLNWQLNGSSMVGLLTALAPYLRLKGDQALLAVELQPLLPGNKRDSLGRMLPGAIPQQAFEIAASLKEAKQQEPKDSGVRLDGDAGVAYLAGFFDAEGSVGVYDNGVGRLAVRAQTCQARSEAIAVMFNGWVSVHGGQVRTQVREGAKTKLNWCLGGQETSTLMTLLRPHLKLKSVQAGLAIEFQSLLPGARRDAQGRLTASPLSPRAAEIEAEMRALKKDIRAVGPMLAANPLPVSLPLI